MDFDYGRYHRLGEGFERGAIRVDSIDEIPDPYALTRAEVTPTTPVRFRRSEGRRLCDLVGTTWAVLDLVSERVLEVLTEHRFTGWKTYPVELYGRNAEPIDGYHGLAVTGRCGAIDDSLSPVVTLPPGVPEGEAQPQRIGLRFHPETWDGSDVFTPEGTAHVFVAQPVRDALVDAKVTNITLTPLAEIAEYVLDDDEAV